MKPAVVFIVTFAFTLGFGALFIVIGKAAEPVDAFVTPVPAPSQGTGAAILPPGTYHAVTPDGVRLSGWVHSPDTSRFPTLKKAPSPPQKAKMPQRDPQLRFVPVEPGPHPRPNR
ncbi:hypothetical protein [Roseimicrobium sp. ORNL1]|uniref:hypothetical protein n=1 Tax=Roseimicrobium sp. ORNL1 TaxID=2711231 RepID=UPI0013E12617|nr:hypothetical protein [Roseimicrobium sp. ORNL1]QIF03757.1 hypothetical protein G5S37_20270 [Roseimicrobium sp. ORNL1]